MTSSWLPKPSLKDKSNQEGLVTLIPSHLLQHHSISVIKPCLHNQQTSQWLLNDGRCPNLMLTQYIRSKAGHHSEAGTEARDNKSYAWSHLSHLPSHQIMDSKVTEVQHQLPHQWHQCLRDWEVLGVHTMADSPVGNLEAMWRSTCQSTRVRTQRMTSHTKAGAGT